MSNNEDPQSGPLGNQNPDKRGRGSGSGPRKDVKGSGRKPPTDSGKGAPDKDKSK